VLNKSGQIASDLTEFDRAPGLIWCALVKSGQVTSAVTGLDQATCPI